MGNVAIEECYEARGDEAVISYEVFESITKSIDRKIDGPIVEATNKIMIPFGIDGIEYFNKDILRPIYYEIYWNFRDV